MALPVNLSSNNPNGYTLGKRNDMIWPRSRTPAACPSAVIGSAGAAAMRIHANRHLSSGTSSEQSASLLLPSKVQ